MGKTRPLAVRLLEPVDQWLAADALPALKWRKAFRAHGRVRASLRMLAAHNTPLALRLMNEGAATDAAYEIASAVNRLTDPARFRNENRSQALLLKSRLKQIIETQPADAPARREGGAGAGADAPAPPHRKDIDG